MASSAILKILLQPVRTGSSGVFHFLENELPRLIPGSSYDVSSRPLQLPASAYDEKRGQWISPETLKAIMTQIIAYPYDKVLGICDFDAYASGLNFVFGEAHLGGRAVAIYLPRLRQEFYGLPPDENLFLQRVLKEAVHELGHSLALGHCPNPACVMHFSNSLSDTDRKSASFCSNCSQLG